MRAAALAYFENIVGASGVISDEAASQPFLIDERRLYHGCALAIVFPRTTNEVAAIVRYCAGNDIPMVPQGGNTSYCGAATPDTSGRAVVINLRRMDRIATVDIFSSTIEVEGGVVLSAVQHAADERGLLFPLSMGSEGTAQIGGALATNAGGLAVLRYGTARDLVLGLEVVLPDGSLWNGLSALRKDNTGYDLKHLFMGAEGTLGIITRAVLKLFPRPSQRETILFALDSLAGAIALLTYLRNALGDSVVSFEYITRESLELVINEIAELRDPFELPYPAYVLVEVVGFAQDRLQEISLESAEHCLREHLIHDAMVATSLTQRGHWWTLRERIPAAERLSGGTIKHDVSVSLSQLPALEAKAKAAVLALLPAARFSIYGHVGDGNLHFNVRAPAGESLDEFRPTLGEAISREVHNAAIGLHGSFSGEHGIGQLKRSLLRETAGVVEIELMSHIKRALDPKGLMNPGKVL